ncbi:sporulation protein [Streptomyces sp. NPDC002057]|uniref:sporulation protein n=1 Tax=Streptomyces sp. NPDC002057 TaxID=3154664 RepID=UPI003318E412
MVFKRLLGSLGIGGPSVDTVLDPGAVTPGGTLSGQVHLKGGSADSTVEHLTVELVAHVEAEHDGGESEGTVVFHRQVVGGSFRLAEGEPRSVPFSFPLPWETPITELYGQGLGITLGVRTELGIAGGKDKGDLDPLAVRPLPAQEAVLDAFGRLGFGFRSADLELGHIQGTGQRLPFYQEIEVTPSPRYAHQVDEIEVTFLAGPAGMEVVLEADRRGGLLSEGHDSVSRHTVGHHDVDQVDWNAEVESWMRQLVEHAPHASPSPYGSPDAHAHGAPSTGVDPHGHHAHGTPSTGDDPHGHHGDGHGHRSGPGLGTAVAVGAAGLAVGVVGGMVAAEAVDEIGDFLEGDEEEEEDQGDEG